MPRPLRYLLLPVAAPLIWLGCKYHNDMAENDPPVNFRQVLHDWLHKID